MFQENVTNEPKCQISFLTVLGKFVKIKRFWGCFQKIHQQRHS